MEPTQSDEKTFEQNQKDYWKVRRRLVISVLTMSYLILTYLIINGVDTSVLHENIASGMCMLIAATISGYIGVAVYDDINMKDESNAMTSDSKFWFVRRMLVITNVLFSFGMVFYLLWKGDPDSDLQSVVISNLLLTTVAVIVTYIGGASIQDRYIKKVDKGRY